MEVPLVVLVARMMHWDPWSETVPSLGILFRLALVGDDGAEHFHDVQSSGHVGQDACETHVFL